MAFRPSPEKEFHMAAILDVQKQMVKANGVELYCEVCGSGPAVLWIAGGSGDSGCFDRVKPELADDFTLITYDRRGGGRSFRAENWSPTSIPGHADDAAALAQAMGVTPVAVFGTSLGANIAIDLLIRHRDAVRAAVLHEPSIAPITAEYYQARGLGEQYRQQREGWFASIQKAWVDAGPAAALEAFFVPIVGEATWRSIDPEQMKRAVASAPTTFKAGATTWEDYRPDDAAVEAIDRPARVLLSSESPANLFEPTAVWLAKRGYPAAPKLPGRHAAYIDRPKEFAAALRPYLIEATDAA
jgi:pimeloyl-ACP methyl ester carboxylesterase